MEIPNPLNYSVLTAMKGTLKDDLNKINSDIETCKVQLAECDKTKDINKYIETQMRLQFYIGMKTENETFTKSIESIETMNLGTLLQWKTGTLKK